MNISPHLKHTIISVIIGIVLIVCSWKIISHLDNAAHDQYILAKAKTDSDIQSAKIQANQSSVDKVALQNQINTLAASNAQLQSSILALRSQLANQSKSDAILTPDALATRWSVLLGLQSNEFQSSPSGVSVSVLAAHSTVDALEELPILRQEEKESIANSADKDDVISGQKKVITDTSVELQTCKKTIKDQDAECKTKIESVKADARKRSFIYTAVSFVSGLILGKRF